MSDEKKRIIEKTLVFVSIPNSWIDFIDHMLGEPDCPWESRSDFVEDCMEFFLQEIMTQSKDLLELIYRNRFDNYFQKVKDKNSKSAKVARERLHDFLKEQKEETN